MQPHTLPAVQAGALPRVAVATESFLPAVDGTTTAVRHLVDRLIDRGHPVLVLASSPGLASYRGAVVVRVAMAERVGRQVKAALKDFAPDLVHAASSGRIGRKALKHGRTLGIATVAIQTRPVRDSAAPVWQSRIADRADVLLSTSRWLVPNLSRLGANAQLWEPGVDTTAFHPNLREQQLHDHWARSRHRDTTARAQWNVRSDDARSNAVVGYAGRIDDAHGIDRLVELADLPGIAMVVIGDGPRFGWLKRRLPHARFTGHLDTGELARAIASLDLLVHPGESESCCQSLREAGASGVPVVAPRAGGATDVVRHQETGMLYSTQELRSFRQAVSHLAADPYRAEMGAPARAAAEQRTWVQAVDELIDQHYPTALAARTPLPATVPAQDIA